MGSKEIPMGSKRTSRRELLKGGATLAGGLTLGVPVHAQTHDHASGPASGSENAYPMIPGNKEMVAYGERSHFVTSVHTAPDGQVTRRVREDIPRGLADPGSVWQHHAVVASLYSDDPPGLHSGHRSQAAYFDDPRPGRSAADLHHG